MQEIQQEQQAQQQQAMALEQSKLQVQAMGTPMMDPSKNPDLAGDEMAMQPDPTAQAVAPSPAG